MPKKKITKPKLVDGDDQLLERALQSYIRNDPELRDQKEDGDEELVEEEEESADPKKKRGRVWRTTDEFPENDEDSEEEPRQKRRMRDIEEIEEGEQMEQQDVEEEEDEEEVPRAKRPKTEAMTQKERQQLLQQMRELKQIRERKQSAQDDLAPNEASSKKPVKMHKSSIAPQRKSLDPRFIGGADGATRTGYRFVEELRRAEYEKAGKELQELKNNGLKMTPEMTKRKEDLLKIRQEYANRDYASKEKQRKKEVQKEWRKDAFENLVNKGVKPKYMKKAEIRDKMREKQYEDLKESGKLKDYLKKKTTKNNAKDKRQNAPRFKR
ncbi:virulent strain associated lipoprotein [Planoprotostelium fungivorum]|uniref:rRNA biogenesis protein RRP36 n=1 Tax=Planoprotostelium fungivorum TaxID=1890364 RepID=A0A2P6NKT9_9EUKA|nr:virulent strain associated lipoprotein [Planoprotostelium fungivorum]